MRTARTLLVAAVAVILIACGDDAGEPAVETPAEIPTTAASIAPATIPPTTNGATTASTTASTVGGSTVPDATTTSTAPAPAVDPFQTLAYEEIDSTVPFPIFMTPIPGTDWSMIASKSGRLWIHDGVDVHDEPFLDIIDLVRNDGEQGLLGVAFVPDYAESRRFFVHYSDNDGDTVIAEYLAGNVLADRSTGTVVYTTGQPAPNHNGGMIQFGPDGFLYVGLGDGGGSNDRFGHGQNEATPLGALLRLDVSVAGVATPAGAGFEADEVWSIGLRNPWRFAIDAPSGLIFIADVGQNGFEEVSAARIGDEGVNYGWPITEGLHCFRPSSGCDTAGLTLPVVEVQHGDGETCSITGGFVYRGSAIPELQGHYFFSDFCGGYLRSFPIDGSAGVTDWTVDVGRLGRVASFGTDAAGELYVLSGDGDIFRIVAVRG